MKTMHVQSISREPREFAFSVNGTKYLGTLSLCDCGSIVGVNCVTVTNAPARYKFVALDRMPRELWYDEDKGDYVCEDCA